MNTTVDTTAMDPIVFSTTFNAAQKLAEAQDLRIQYNRDVRDFELVSTLTGRVFGTFGNVLEVKTWLEQSTTWR